MAFQWLSTSACHSCNVIPSAAEYDDFGYPVCPNCGTIIRCSDAAAEQVAHAETD